jgi:hypothetical protein
MVSVLKQPHRDNYYMLNVRKMLNPDAAVEMTTPGSWGWKCSSFMSFWPWWMNMS